MQNNPKDISQKKAKSTFKQLWKGVIKLIVGWILGLIIFVVISLTWIYVHGNDFAKAELQKLVSKQSNGLYQLKIGDVDIDWFNSSVSFTNISLKIDKTKRKELNSEKQFKNKFFSEFSLRNFKLKNIHIGEYLWSKNIQLEEIVLDEPNVFLEQTYKKPKHKREKTEELIILVAKKLRKFLNRIEVGKLSIHGANFVLETPNDGIKIKHQVKGVNLELSQIYFNSKVNKARNILKLGELLANLRTYTFQLGEVIYQASVENLQIASQDSSIRIQNLKLAPKSIEANKETYRTLKADLEAESVLLTQIDFNSFLYEKKIVIGNWQMQDILANISLDKTLPQKQRLIQKSLEEFLKDLPIFIKIDAFSIENAKVAYEEKFKINPQKTSKIYHQADSIVIKLQHLALGLASMETERKNPLYSDKIEVQFKNYEHQTADALYQVNLQEGYISSSDSLLRIRHGKLTPLVSPAIFNQRKSYQTMQIDAKIENLLCNQIDVEKLLYTQVFDMNALHIYQPDFQTFLDLRKPTLASEDYHNFEDFLHRIPLDIRVDTLQIHEAKVFHQEQSETDFGAGIAQHKAQNISLQALQIRLGKALAKEEYTLSELDTKNVVLGMENYEFHSPDSFYVMRFDKFRFLANQGKFWIDSLKIKPKVDMPQVVADTINLASIYDINIAKIEAGKVDYQKLILYQEFDFGLLNLKNADIKIKHNLEIAEKIKNQKDTNVVELNVVEPPYRRLTSPHNQLQSHQDLRQMFASLPLFIKIDTFLLENAQIDYQEILHNENLDSISYHQAENINLVVPKILLGQAYREAENQFFYTDEVFLDLENYRYKSRNNLYELSLKNVESDLAKSQLKIEELNVKPTKNKIAFAELSPYRQTYFESKFKSIAINDLDVERMIFDRELVVHKLELNQPSFELYTDKRKSKNPNKRFSSLEDVFKAIPIFISVDTFQIKDANLKNENQVLIQNIEGTSLHDVQNIDVMINALQLGQDVKTRWNCDEIQGKVENYTFKLPNNLYQINLENSYISLRDSTFSVENVYLEPLVSSFEFDSLVKYQTPYLTDTRVKKIAFENVNFLKMLADEGFDIGKVTIQQPILDIYLNKLLPLNPHRKYTKIKEILKSIAFQIQVDTLEIQNANLSYTEETAEEEGTKQRTQKLDSLNVCFYNMQIDSINSQKSTKLIYSDNFEFDFKNYRTQNEDYHISLGKMQGSTQKQTLNIQNFELKPTKADSIFFDYKTYQTDMFKIKVGEVEVQKIDYHKMLREQEITLQKLVLYDDSIQVYRDKSLPRDSAKFPKMPNILVQKIPVALKIDSMEVHNLYVKYSEKVPKGVGIGSIEISEIQALMRNFSTQGDTNQITYAEGNGKLMKQGNLELTMQAKLLSPAFECKYKANLGEMQASFFNKIITSNVHIRVKKGNIRKAIYQAKMNDKVIKGSLSAAYRKLKIQVLKSNNQKKKTFLTFFANLIIKNRNNIKRKIGQTKVVEYEHQVYEGFITYIWKALAAGLIKTLK